MKNIFGRFQPLSILSIALVMSIGMGGQLANAAAIDPDASDVQRRGADGDLNEGEFANADPNETVEVEVKDDGDGSEVSEEAATEKSAEVSEDADEDEDEESSDE